MPLYNVEMTLVCTIVVQAESEEEARDVGRSNWKDGMWDCDPQPELLVTGEVTDEIHLRDGWCAQCHPYGGDQTIAEILKINEPSEGGGA